MKLFLREGWRGDVQRAARKELNLSEDADERAAAAAFLRAVEEEGFAPPAELLSTFNVAAGRESCESLASLAADAQLAFALRWMQEASSAASNGRLQLPMARDELGFPPAVEWTKVRIPSSEAPVDSKPSRGGEHGTEEAQRRRAVETHPMVRALMVRRRLDSGNLDDEVSLKRTPAPPHAKKNSLAASTKGGEQNAAPGNELEQRRDRNSAVMAFLFAIAVFSVLPAVREAVFPRTIQPADSSARKVEQVPRPRKETAATKAELAPVAPAKEDPLHVRMSRIMMRLSHEEQVELVRKLRAYMDAPPKEMEERREKLDAALTRLEGELNHRPGRPPQ